MKKMFFAAVIAVMALTASVNANAQNMSAGEGTVVEIAATLTPEVAYTYTVLCQKFIIDQESVNEATNLTDAQKQKRINALTDLYIDRFSQFLDSWQTLTTIKALGR